MVQVLQQQQRWLMVAVGEGEGGRGCSGRPGPKGFCSLRSLTTRRLALQIGDFFETFGIDAVLAMEYGGLNPMGGQPMAGVPIRGDSIRQLGRNLVWNADTALEVVSLV